MAKTTKKKATEARAKAARPGKKGVLVAGRQAPTGAWSPDVLLDALRRGTDDEKVAILKKAGILDADGKLTKTYENWGSKVTRTPYADREHA
ncbi:MAG: hypothetical protein IPJ34_40315 [Myxococcales bacterium]|nr:hypothetical protein [Myxococcales bacterium]